MDFSDTKRRGNRIVEENFLVIFEADDCRDTLDNHDDRIAFLEAVRSSCLAPQNGTSPTKKMYQAVYEIMRAGKSLELIVESFLLLSKLDKTAYLSSLVQRYPRVSLRNAGGSKELQLVMAEEAWNPFALNLDAGSVKKEAVNKNNSKPLDALAFHVLIQELDKIESPEIQSLRSMLLFQYLVDVLEEDFMLRNKLFKETLNSIPMKESLLHLLLSSRKIQYKSLIRDCLAAFFELIHPSSALGADLDATKDVVISESSAAVAIIWEEVKHNTCTALQKLLVAIMEFDVSMKVVDAKRSTSRADAARSRAPVIELVLDELLYEKEMLSPFLQRFNEPKWKTELILLYFQKYTAKPSVRTRSSNDLLEDLHTISGILKGFSNFTTAKSIARKIGADVVQLLIAHAFQAHLSLCSSKQDGEGTTDDAAGSSVVEMCEDVIAAFNSLKKTASWKLEIQPIGKEALFTAAMILSTKT
ncbi:Negative regulator of systemic acquired resistance SNI1 [Linum perenne]